MFEDSLVESTGRIRTRSRRYVAGSFLLEAALVTTLILIPYLYPSALPERFLSVPLIAPPPAPAPVMVAQHGPSAPISHPEMLMDTVMAPRRIPNGISHIVDPNPPSLVIGGDFGGSGSGIPGAILPGATPPSAPRVEPARPRGPVHVSGGLAEGRLIVPIQPVYPAIAREAHIQGTVVVEAIISTSGRIENTHVVSGPPLLVQAALNAIQQARYRPFLLNNQPIEVETTIRVVFTLN
ncbi:MAG TPA: energy transducer TonB [Acidobacteriaceae bacterium]|nr:energy transducer TonB [Acidobacteriaceae bacterium]